MAGLIFSKCFLVIPALVFHLEFFFFYTYRYSIYFVKLLQVNRTVEAPSIKSGFSYNKLYYYILFLLILIAKSSTGCPTIVIPLLCVYLLAVALRTITLYDKVVNSSVYYFITLFGGLLLLLAYVKSLLGLFFFLEVYGVLYFFVFLMSTTNTLGNILKYKNGILMLLWNNFLTTFTICFSCFLVLWSVGTTDFVELSLLSIPAVYYLIYLIGLFWKLGMPVFHFFKVEVYKFLAKESVFFFSIITLVINTTFLSFLLSNDIFFNFLYTNSMILVVFIFFTNLVIVNLKVNSILYFLALSGLITLCTFLVTCLYNLCSYWLLNLIFLFNSLLNSV